MPWDKTFYGYLMDLQSNVYISWYLFNKYPSNQGVLIYRDNYIFNQKKGGKFYLHNMFFCNYEAAACVKSLSKAKSKPAGKYKEIISIYWDEVVNLQLST